MGEKHFEDLDCWKKAREFMNNIYELTLKEEFDSMLKNQLRSASIATMTNITEGYVRKNKKDLLKFLCKALVSASEVQNQLYVAFDQKYIKEKEFQKGYDQSAAVKIYIDNFLFRLQRKKIEQ